MTLTEYNIEVDGLYFIVMMDDTERHSAEVIFMKGVVSILELQDAIAEIIEVLAIDRISDVRITSPGTYGVNNNVIVTCVSTKELNLDINEDDMTYLFDKETDS